MTRSARLCYAGTYERNYPRNLLIVRALRDAGAHVEEAHAPVFELIQDKSAVTPYLLLLLALKLSLAYLRLVPEVMLRLLRCDALVIGYIGQLDMLVLGPAARLMKKPVIFNPLVTLTDTLVEDRRRFSAGSIPAHAVALIDALALRLADVILVDTEENGDYLRERFSVPASRIVTVAVGADETMFHPPETPPANETLDILFYGKFIPLHGTETVIRAAAILEQRNVPVRMELIGTGQEYRQMREIAARLEVSTIVWTDWIPFEQLGERVQQADVVLGIFDDGPKADRVIPNKIYQALACCKPVITRSSPAIDRYLTDGESALLVPPADPPALADAIERLGNPDGRARIASCGCQAWNAWGSRAALAGQAKSALTRLGLAP